ncbi:hypothetical protein J6590_063889 [Homalodisca vitripennis]|nr:hypothetical protein J6590_063889 [Homalodisca vitripennis]
MRLWLSNREVEGSIRCKTYGRISHVMSVGLLGRQERGGGMERRLIAQDQPTIARYQAATVEFLIIVSYCTTYISHLWLTFKDSASSAREEIISPHFVITYGRISHVMSVGLLVRQERVGGMERRLIAPDQPTITRYQAATVGEFRLSFATPLTLFWIQECSDGPTFHHRLLCDLKNYSPLSQADLKSFGKCLSGFVFDRESEAEGPILHKFSENPDAL